MSATPTQAPIAAPAISPTLAELRASVAAQVAQDSVHAPLAAAIGRLILVLIDLVIAFTEGRLAAAETIAAPTASARPARRSPALRTRSVPRHIRQAPNDLASHVPASNAGEPCPRAIRAPHDAAPPPGAAPGAHHPRLARPLPPNACPCPPHTGPPAKNRACSRAPSRIHFVPLS